MPEDPRAPLWQSFRDRGWLRFPADPMVADWLPHALAAARQAVSDPAHARWHDCEGTWFVGVDALPNDPAGRVGGSGPLQGQAMAFIAGHLQTLPLHRGQVSVTYPGYPRPRRGESGAAFRYRRNRDAAHVDGLKPSGPDRRRQVAEPHAWILGLPLTRADNHAAPLVVWEGSHRIIGAAFADALSACTPETMTRMDVTGIYQAARREAFDTCRRVPLPAGPGEALLLHRHMLHGIAPWGQGARAGPDGRMMAYFRPECPGGMAEWIEST